MKIVINDDFGGFSISLEAARFMAARGNAKAAEEVAEYDGKAAKRIPMDRMERECGKPHWYGFGHCGYGENRTDPDLVAAVETLGRERASGDGASLKVIEIPEGVDWEICEYDGAEWVAEKHRRWD